MTKQEIVRPYLEKFPDHADMTLAKKIYKENSLYFSSLDNCRAMVRYYRGHYGKKHREVISDIKHVKPLTYNTNPYKLPDSDETVREPFILPKVNNNILLLPDLHFPYHNITAITLALNYGKKEKVNTIILNGDVLDCHKISRFQQDPTKRDMRGEFDTVKEFLRILRRSFPNAGIYWLKGNHELRYEHYLMAKAPELFNDPYYLMEERLRLNEEKIHLIDDKVLVKAGKLFIHHGHLFFKGFMAPVNSARGLFMKAKQSIICSHVHKFSSHSETNINGDLVTCWTTACLCELSPDYNPYGNNYSNGFAHITVEDSGLFNVKNYQVHKGKML